ncbi:hypothetical protein ACFO3J_24275 [Streptomyces polygonati]|uniref:Uncharacterized protein n=1 Tax=Streptomyces polygonati TaxID=1617087 RepID=A0ABV8HUK4_9ACTN
MPSRIYRNLIPGEQCIHVELTAHDILDILDDDLRAPRFAAGRQLLRILNETADVFGVAATGTAPGGCPGHEDCPRCDVTDPCPCCGLHYVGAGRWAPALKLCGAQHIRWPETVCTEQAGHGAGAPHAGPIVADGRRIDGGVAWGGPVAPTPDRTETGTTIHNPQVSHPGSVDNPADTEKAEA